MVTVRDIMTPAVVSVSPDDMLVEAMDLIVENKISGLPVIDETGRLVGIISEFDRIKLLSDETTDLTTARVSQWMTHGVITVDENATLDQVAELLVRASIRRIPVTSDGQVIGIVGRRDLVRALNVVPDDE
jgi:CBS domain-containing protein